MKKFVVIYNSPASAVAAMANISDEEKAKGMAPWMAWHSKFENQINDLGAPLMPGIRLDDSGTWTNSNAETNGYSMVQGEDLESVKAMFEDHPHVGWAPGCTIEVFECAEM